MQHLKRKSVVRQNQEMWDYQARVIAAGGTIQQATLNAIDIFITKCKTTGIWPLLLDVGPLAGDQLAAALVKLKYPVGAPSVLANGGFVGGDYTESGINGGLHGNGAKYLNTGVTAPAGGGALAFHLRGAAGLRSYLMGATDVANNFLLYDPVESEFSMGVVVADAEFNGAVVGSLHDAHSQFIYQNGVRVAVGDPGGLSAPSGASIYLFAADSDGDPVQPFSGKGCFYAIANALTEPQAAVLSNAILDLQTTLSRP